MRNFYTIIVLFLFCIISACNKDKTNESEAIDNKVSLQGVFYDNKIQTTLNANF